MRRSGRRWVGLYSQELLSLGCTHPAKLHWPGLAGHPPVDTENKVSLNHISLGNLSLWLPWCLPCTLAVDLDELRHLSPITRVDNHSIQGLV